MTRIAQCSDTVTSTKLNPKKFITLNYSNFLMDNIQQIADAVQKGLQLILRASAQQGSTRLRRLCIELCSDSFHVVLALSCGRAKCQCCITTVTVVVYTLYLKILKCDFCGDIDQNGVANNFWTRQIHSGPVCYGANVFKVCLSFIANKSGLIFWEISP